MNENIALLRQVETHGLQVDLGSDWHFLEHSDPQEVVNALLKDQKSAYLFLPGDIFHAPDSIDTSSQINEVLHLLQRRYTRIIFTPGNHDLRGREGENPWENFGEWEDKVIIPRSEEPVILSIDGVRILPANLFWDQHYFPEGLLEQLDTNANEALDFYKEIMPDGKTPFEPDLAVFTRMAENIRTCLHDDIQVVIGHCLPHPCQSHVYVAPQNQATLLPGLEEEFGVPIDVDAAKTYAIYLEQYCDNNEHFFQQRYAQKGYWMGSNVFSGNEFSDGITSFFGHNHRNVDEQCSIEGKSIRFVAHQPEHKKALV